MQVWHLPRFFLTNRSEMRIRMKIAVRMDDIVPHMDWERFLAMKELLDAHGIRPLIGVVPDNRDEQLDRKEKNKVQGLPLTEPGEDPETFFWRYIRQLQEEGWSIALHGYQHLYTSQSGGLFPLNLFSEFAGVEAEKQREMIAAGRKILESHGIHTDLFMAPAHSYDRHTLAALQAEGFHRITDGFGRRPYRRSGMIFYPIAFRLKSSLKKKGVTTMVLHTNTMSDRELEECGRIFSSEEMISYDAYLEMEPCQRGLAGCLGEYLMAAGKRWLVQGLRVIRRLGRS